MNIQAIKRNCVARGTARVIETVYGDQWISDGNNAWPVQGLWLTAEGLEALFNLNRKQTAEMGFYEGTITDERFTRDNMPLEEHTKEAAVVMLCGELVVALPSHEGMLFIPHEPIRHIKTDYRGYAIRWKDGRPLVAVYQGMFCEALVCPVDNGDAEAIRRMAEDMLHVFHWREHKADEAEEVAEAMVNQAMERLVEERPVLKKAKEEATAIIEAAGAAVED